MLITIDRKYKKDTYTISNLYIDRKWFCNALEDKDRGLKQTDSLSTIKARKVYGETAIPSGKYIIAMNVVSPKFASNTFYKRVCQGKVPRLLNVPGWEGVLIHSFNDATQSQGCIGPGLNKIKGKLVQSREYFEKLYKLMKAAYDKGEKIEILIK